MNCKKCLKSNPFPLKKTIENPIKCPFHAISSETPEKQRKIL